MCDLSDFLCSGDSLNFGSFAHWNFSAGQIFGLIGEYFVLPCMIVHGHLFGLVTHVPFMSTH